MSKRHYITIPPIERFENFIIMEPMSGCWLWTGATTPLGYGVFWIGPTQGIFHKSHRVAWLFYKGPIPEGLCVLHKCDNPSCVNPHHLFLGTDGDNAKDSINKGRWRIGERHWNAKLTAEQVRQIRRDTRTIRFIAQEYGVTYANIYAIKHRLSWIHI